MYCNGQNRIFPFNFSDYKQYIVRSLVSSFMSSIWKRALYSLDPLPCPLYCWWVLVYLRPRNMQKAPIVQEGIRSSPWPLITPWGGLWREKCTVCLRRMNNGGGFICVWVCVGVCAFLWVCNPLHNNDNWPIRWQTDASTPGAHPERWNITEKSHKKEQNIHSKLFSLLSGHQ